MKISLENRTFALYATCRNTIVKIPGHTHTYLASVVPASWYHYHRYIYVHVHAFITKQSKINKEELMVHHVGNPTMSHGSRSSLNSVVILGPVLYICTHQTTHRHREATTHSSFLVKLNSTFHQLCNLTWCLTGE